MSDCIKKGLFELLNNVYFTGFFWVRISLRNILFGFSTNYFRGLGLRIRVMEGWFGEKISERQD